MPVLLPRSSSSSSLTEEEDQVSTPISSQNYSSDSTLPTSTESGSDDSDSEDSVQIDKALIPKMNVPNHRDMFVESHSEKAELYPFLYGTLKEGGVLRTLGMNDTMARLGFEAISASDAKYLDEGWRKLQLMEAELCILRASLVEEQIELFVDAFTSDIDEETRETGGKKKPRKKPRTE